MPGLSTAMLCALVEQDRSRKDLERYFATAKAGDSWFTGGSFERLAGGGDRADTCRRITADDLIAVTMLSVDVPAPVALDLLEGELGREVAAELGQIPTDVKLGTDGARQLVTDDTSAARAWRLLRDCDGVGWVTAGKLMARKRPHLIPVYDNVVRCAYRSGRDFWVWLHDRLADDGGLAEALYALRDGSNVPPTLSHLRVLDVVVWMRHRDQHRPRRCPGIVV